MFVRTLYYGQARDTNSGLAKNPGTKGIPQYVPENYFPFDERPWTQAYKKSTFYQESWTKERSSVMKIVGVMCTVENESGQKKNITLSFDQFIAHICAIQQASGGWDIKKCDKLRDEGANSENYERS